MQSKCPVHHWSHCSANLTSRRTCQKLMRRTDQPHGTAKLFRMENGRVDPPNRSNWCSFMMFHGGNNGYQDWTWICFHVSSSSNLGASTRKLRKFGEEIIQQECSPQLVDSAGWRMGDGWWWFQVTCWHFSNLFNHILGWSWTNILQCGSKPRDKCSYGARTTYLNGSFTRQPKLVS